jgi:nitronate monooxygenase
MRAAASKRGDADRMSLWAGQAYPLARPGKAAELVHRIAEEYHLATEALLQAMRG